MQKFIVCLCFGLLIGLISALSPAACAETKFAFGDVSLNFLDWTRGTEDKSIKKDFTYFELEGGGLYGWGELYGFFDLENIGRSGSIARSAAKGTIAYYLFNTPLSLYAQVYNFSATGFAEQNQVLGLQYAFNSARGWWFKPFLGIHEVVQTFYSGHNGFMGGWTIGVPFKIGSQPFIFIDWHEIEFAREASYAKHNGGRIGHNGAASMWWIIGKWSPGIQWRYAYNKLGTGGDQGAVIYSLKAGF